MAVEYTYSVRDRAVTPRCFGRLRLDWVVLLGRRVQEMVACIQKYILIYFPGDSFRSTPKQVYTINKHTFINTKDGRTQSATDIRRTRHIIETARHRLTVHRSHGPYSTHRFRRNIFTTQSTGSGGTH